MGNSAVESLKTLLRWMVVAAAVGPACGYVAVLFKRLTLSAATDLYITRGNFFYLLPLAGAGMVAVLYFYIRDSSEGGSAYVTALQDGDGRLSASGTLGHFVTAGIVLATGGSGGLVGPMVRVCAGVGQQVSRAVPDSLKDADAFRQAAICGASAGICGILGAPIAGGVFAVELLYADGIRYLDVFPAMLASAGAYAVVYTRADYEPFLGYINHPGGVHIRYLPAFVVLAAAVALFGVLFCKSFALVDRTTRRWVAHPSLRVLLGALLVAGTAWAFGPVGRASLGAGTLFIREIAAGHLPQVSGMPMPANAPLLIAGLLLVLALAKMLATSFTIGSGLSVGLTFPSVYMGASLGAAASQLASAVVPITFETHYAFVACGVAAMLTSVMNIPLAATVLVGEIFGLEQSFVAIIGSVVAFALAKPVVIYHYGVRAARRDE